MSKVGLLGDSNSFLLPIHTNRMSGETVKSKPSKKRKQVGKGSKSKKGSTARTKLQFGGGKKKTKAKQKSKKKTSKKVNQIGGKKNKSSKKRTCVKKKTNGKKK